MGKRDLFQEALSWVAQAWNGHPEIIRAIGDRGVLEFARASGCNAEAEAAAATIKQVDDLDPAADDSVIIPALRSYVQAHSRLFRAMSAQLAAQNQGTLI